MHSRFSQTLAGWASSTPKAYPEDIQCIIDPQEPSRGGIYVGNVEAAQNIITLNRLNIKAVLTACSGVTLNHPPSQIPHVKHVPAEDRESFNLAHYFDDSVEWIKEKLKSTNILIHCMAGISRSVSLLLAYLIKEQGIQYNEAFELVKRRRRIINPNRGFIEQLKKYQDKHHKKDSQSYRFSSQHRRGTSLSNSHAAVQDIPRSSFGLTSDLSKYNSNERGCGYGSRMGQSLGKKDRLSERELDIKIQQIRNKYSRSNRTSGMYEGTPSMGMYNESVRGPSVYEMPRSLKFSSSTYNRGCGRERLNPEVYSGSANPLFKSFLYSGGY